jgi:hypothetical protein
MKEQEIPCLLVYLQLTHDSAGKFGIDNWIERKRHQLMLHNNLFRVVQAHLLGFSTGITLSWKRFCLFCPFHTPLSITGCLIQLVYTKFPSRVIHTPGCVKDPNWEKGGLMRALLDRSGPLYKVIYNQRTACERINSQAQALGIERPKVRNIHSVRNLNTLIYLVINVRALAKAKSINKGLLQMN